MDLAEKEIKKWRRKDQNKQNTLKNKDFNTQKNFSKKVLTNWFSFGIIDKLAREKLLRGTNERERTEP